MTALMRTPAARTVPEQHDTELRRRAFFAVRDGAPDADLIQALAAEVDRLQGLLDDLWQLFTSSSEEIAATFGESRCRNDSARINYALELMASSMRAEIPPSPTKKETGK